MRYRSNTACVDPALDMLTRDKLLFAELIIIIFLSYRFYIAIYPITFRIAEQ